jgi:hypothetical protein
VTSHTRKKINRRQVATEAVDLGETHSAFRIIIEAWSRESFNQLSAISSNSFIVVELHHDACYIVGAASRVGNLREFPGRGLWYIFCFSEGDCFLFEKKESIANISTKELQSYALLCCTCHVLRPSISPSLRMWAHSRYGKCFVQSHMQQ